MIRKILFRGKRIDNGEWVEGYYVNIAKINSFISTGKLKLKEATEGYFCPEMYAVDSSTICQYTGLTDKNGKKIWENDIATGFFGGKKIVGYIKYGSNAQYFIERNGLYGIYLDNSEDWIEIIGNIFDNPELMEGD